jgi:outer membrane protein assembly factor BamB
MPTVATFWILQEVIMKRALLLGTIGLLVLANTVRTADWPNWLGPQRNGSSPETGLLTTWPAEGPKVLWKVPGGDGYSSVAVANDQAVTLVQVGQDELVLALNANSGKELWKARIGPAFKNQYGNGPRSTPTLEGNRIYVQSVNGPLVCLEADSGKKVWQHDLLQEFKAKNISWGLSASPVIHGDLVLAIPGGPGAGVVAFNKKTGEFAWKVGDDKAAYATPIEVKVGGQTQIIFFTASGLLAVAPDQGKELWRVPWHTEYDCNICTPLVVGDKLFVSSGEGNGGVMYELSAGGPPTVVWESKGKKSVMLNYWANAVAHDGFLYGLSGEFSGKIHLNCVDAKTGKLMWSQENFGKGAITLADGHLFITTKPGDLVLVRANPQKYEEKARVTVLGENRTVPTIANKKLYLRDRQNILCLDIAGK